MEGTFRIAQETGSDRHDWGSTRWVSHPASTGGQQLTVLEATFAPGGGHGFHRHPHQEEVLYVTLGRVEQWLDREMRMLAPGDAVFIPAGMVHGSHNASEGPSKVLAIFGPCVGEGFTTEEMALEEPWSRLRA